MLSLAGSDGQYFSKYMFSFCDEEATDLLNKMLTFNPHHRPSAKECLGHSYFKEFDLDQLQCSTETINLKIERLTHEELIAYFHEMCSQTTKFD